jgi:hypothetical protein
MKNWNDFFNEISENDLLEIAKEAEDLRITGVCPNGVLRSWASEWILNVNKSMSLNSTINVLINETHRHFALLYINKL